MIYQVAGKDTSSCRSLDTRQRCWRISDGTIVVLAITVSIANGQLDPELHKIQYG